MKLIECCHVKSANIHHKDSMKSTFMNGICRAFVIWTLVGQWLCFHFCLVQSQLWPFLLALVHDTVIVFICWWLVLCRWHLLCLRIWTTSDLLHLISDLCGFCVPANIRTTLRRNTGTKRSWSTATAAQTSTGINTKRKTRTKRRGEKRRCLV